MNTLNRNAIAACLGLLALAGCEGKPAAETAKQAPGAPGQPTPAITVPATLFATSAPEGAVALVAAKASAAEGDLIVFEARIGGRDEPFVANRAVFFVADSSLESCDQMPGDTCKKPWDYCCEPRDNLLKHMATVQIVDASGAPLKLSLQDSHGLAPLQTVFITGTVHQNDDDGNFVVNAESVYVKEG